MFSGIIEATAPVLERTESTLRVERPVSFSDLMIGSSIAVSGVCLSVVAFDAISMTFCVVAETWEKSKLRFLMEGDFVNLERSVLADERLDGHIVQGHVEAVGCVEGSIDSGELHVVVPKELNKFFIQKGSVAIDGVSLTVASIAEDGITIALIPHTLAETTLHSLQEGDPVNIETDVVGRYLYAFTHEEVPTH